MLLKDSRSLPSPQGMNLPEVKVTDRNLNSRMPCWDLLQAFPVSKRGKLILVRYLLNQQSDSVSKIAQ